MRVLPCPTWHRHTYIHTCVHSTQKQFATVHPSPPTLPSSLPTKLKSATHHDPFVELLEQARGPREERRRWRRRRGRVRVLKGHPGRPHPLRILRVLWMLRVLLRVRHHLARRRRRRRMYSYSGRGAVTMRRRPCPAVWPAPCRSRSPGRRPRCPWRCSRFWLLCFRLLRPAGSFFRSVRHCVGGWGCLFLSLCPIRRPLPCVLFYTFVRAVLRFTWRFAATGFQRESGNDVKSSDIWSMLLVMQFQCGSRLSRWL